MSGRTKTHEVGSSSINWQYQIGAQLDQSDINCEITRIDYDFSAAPDPAGEQNKRNRFASEYPEAHIIYEQLAKIIIFNR